MDPLPTKPGFYIRPAIPGEVYHLTITTFAGVQYFWDWWCVGSQRAALAVPLKEMRRIAELGDLVMLVPEES